MSRLIDADALIEDLQIKRSLEDNLCCRCCLDVIIEIVDAQPTAYNVDKVVEELEEEKNKLYNARNKLSEKMYVDKSAFNRVQVLQAKELSIHEAIEIVKGGGVNGRN